MWNLVNPDWNVTSLIWVKYWNGFPFDNGSRHLSLHWHFLGINWLYWTIFGVIKRLYKELHIVVRHLTALPKLMHKVKCYLLGIAQIHWWKLWGESAWKGSTRCLCWWRSSWLKRLVHQPRNNLWWQLNACWSRHIWRCWTWAAAADDAVAAWNAWCISCSGGDGDSPAPIS